jgi:hypothetical protein
MVYDASRDFFEVGTTSETGLLLLLLLLFLLRMTSAISLGLSLLYVSSSNRQKRLSCLVILTIHAAQCFSLSGPKASKTNSVCYMLQVFVRD